MTEAGDNSGTFIFGDDGATYFVPTSALAPFRLSDEDAARVQSTLDDASDEVSGFAARSLSDSSKLRFGPAVKEVSFSRSLSIRTQGPIIKSGTSSETIMDWDLF